MAALIAGTPIATLTECEQLTGHQGLASHDRSGNAWQSLLAQTSIVARIKLGDTIDVDKIINAEVLKEWASIWAVARILYQEASEDGDRYFEQAKTLERREAGVWNYSVRALKTSDPKRAVGRAMPKAFNVTPSSHSLLPQLSPGAGLGRMVYNPSEMG